MLFILVLFVYIGVCQAKEKRENDEVAERNRKEQEWAAEVRNQMTKHEQQAREEKRLEAEEGSRSEWT